VVEAAVPTVVRRRKAVATTVADLTARVILEIVRAILDRGREWVGDRAIKGRRLVGAPEHFSDGLVAPAKRAPPQVRAARGTFLLPEVWPSMNWHG